MRLGPLELGLLLVAVLMLFGAGRIGEVFSQFGAAVRNLRGGGGRGPRIPAGIRTPMNVKPPPKDDDRRAG